MTANNEFINEPKKNCTKTVGFVFKSEERLQSKKELQRTYAKAQQTKLDLLLQKKPVIKHPTFAQIAVSEHKEFYEKILSDYEKDIIKQIEDKRKIIKSEKQISSRAIGPGQYNIETKRKPTYISIDRYGDRVVHAKQQTIEQVPEYKEVPSQFTEQNHAITINSQPRFKQVEMWKLLQVNPQTYQKSKLK
ncbi:Hypothetical_protein [Hexamita inflata]|uniref:Hypothetical_protein n=1 Tax=Hexamita inflata TaxID=28002 RepID=A0AA86TYL4_9EUKA|nr:Hypothetical protein HINF_LOCUS22275 [Hexamita inflata]